jgi:hypothetical protein
MDEPFRDWQPPKGFLAARRRDVNFESVDGRQVVDVKLGAQGLRDLHGALMHLAILLEEDPAVERAFLVIRFPRLTLEKAQDAWKRARGLLRPDIAARLALVLLLPNQVEPWFDPSDPAVAEIARGLAVGIGGAGDQRLPTRSLAPTSPKFFEFWKALLHGWLRGARPFRLQQLADLVGCSHQTAMRSLVLLDRRGELRSHARDTSRVELGGFPRVTFEQAVGLASVLRRTRWFVDRSGRTPDPATLLRRLEKRRPPNLAIGGVTAARVLDPQFDLHGAPRLDVTLWAPEGAPYDAGFVGELDPGLRESPDKEGAVLAVHRLARAQPLFESRARELPCADPVEVLLDLHEIALIPQAEALVRSLRMGAETATKRPEARP